MGRALSLDTFRSVGAVFAVEGDDMRVHAGRSVVAVTIGSQRHYLKRFWWEPLRPFKRNVARGVHELRMIDWLRGRDFACPIVVEHGSSGPGPIRTRMFFLMEEVTDERPLEAVCRRQPDDVDSILAGLAGVAAKLHDAGFIHTDFSERHILVGRAGEDWTYRLIDVERASVDRFSDRLAAADLATLAASIIDERIRERIKTDFVDRYIANRKTLAEEVDFPALFSNAKPARSFN